MLSFESDYILGAHEKVLEALSDHVLMVCVLALVVVVLSSLVGDVEKHAVDFVLDHE